mmetsp:Transcript_28741/g.39725  ORF Transcript_28741/g.39725 Transcript_28741/m.39725 type:complete len:343 (+) Transcript_28741:317-1345(+)
MIGIEWRVRHFFHQEVARRIKRPDRMHIVIQPNLEGLEVSSRNISLKPQQLIGGLVEQLHCIHGPQRVSGEVAECARGPMNVLQDPLGVRGRGTAKVGFHLGSPDLGQVGHRDGAVQEAPLDLVSEDDVHGVGHFIALHPDQRGLAHHVERRVEVVRRGRAGELGEGALQLGQQVLAEGRMQRHHPLPQQRLTFVDAHAEVRVHGQPVVFQVPALLVKRVPGLVDSSREPLSEVALFEASSHSHVAWVGSSSEGVHRDVEAASVGVEPDLTSNGPAQCRLCFQVECSGEPAVVRPLFASLNLPQQRHQPLLDLLEDLVQASASHAALKLIQTDVVDRARGVD